MSQENTVNTANTATLPPQPTAAVDSATLVTTYADSLMSGLFEDIDRLLEGDESALAALEAGPEDEPDASATADPETTPASEAALAAPATPAIEPYVAPVPTPPTKTPLGKLVDGLLLTSAVVSLLGAIAFLALNQQQQAGDVVSGTEATQGQTDAEFLNYLQRSLDVIAQKVEQRGAENAPFGTTPEVALVPTNPALLPSANGLSPSGRINVIERVYIPYQTAPAASAAQPGSLPPTMVQPGSLQGAVLQPSIPVPVSPNQPATPGVTHVLVGVLELGDRSAALFEINGVSQRVYIGERIGNAGWSLVSVANQEVVVRRNGEVRSIYIGQQF